MTSVAAEGSLSEANHTIGDDRSRLSERTVGVLMLSRSWLFASAKYGFNMPKAFNFK